eukprot:423110_1
MMSTFVCIFTIVMLLQHTNARASVSLHGKWPIHGGNIENQQSTPKTSIKYINAETVSDIEMNCIYESEGSISFNGFVTIDNKNNGYFTDTSGFLKSINLETCAENWSKNIATLLGYNSSTTKIVSRNSVTLYKIGKIKALLFGTPNSRPNSIYSDYEPCYIVSVSLKSGKLLWKTNLGFGLENSRCHLHGFIIDEKSGHVYGGMASGSSSMDPVTQPFSFRGKMMKLDIYNGHLLDTWYSFPDNNAATSDRYSGASAIWNFPALIDEYLIFGTGNLYSYPDRVANCLLTGNDSLIDSAGILNPCGEDISNINVFFKCLEKNVYPSSFVILNKNNFNLEFVQPFNGVDAWHLNCIGFDPQITHGCPRVPGPDADVSAVATYTNKYDGNIYAVIAPKSGMFYVYSVPKGELKISKKIGPWSIGGGSQWSIAVDEDNLIAIVSITGGFWAFEYQYKQEMADGTIICDTGNIHAIDLTTGDTIYQIVNPYGNIGIDNCHDPKYNNYFDYSDVYGNNCERNWNGKNTNDPSQTVKNVIYPPKSDILPINYKRRAIFNAPVTISNNLLFIPSATGDVFVHNILNGEFVHRFECPSEIDKNGNMNRPGIYGGVTVIQNRIVFYCGQSVFNIDSDTFGNKLISMKFKKNPCNHKQYHVANAEEQENDEKISNWQVASNHTNKNFMMVIIWVVIGFVCLLIIVCLVIAVLCFYNKSERKHMKVEDNEHIDEGDNVESETEIIEMK